jgi:hypothetical protein
MTRESCLDPNAFTRPGFVRDAGIHAGPSLMLAALVLIVAGGALLFLPRQPRLRWALPGILALEMVGFVAGQITMARFSDVMPGALRQFIAEHPGDYRVLDIPHPDNGYFLGAGDLGGNNPSVLRRYAEFINFTEGFDPDHATQYLPFESFKPIYAMLRLRYVFVATPKGVGLAESPFPPLPRLVLVSDEKILPQRDDLFSAMHDPTFNPANTVLLESEPEPHPQPGAVGTARLISELPNELIVEVETDKPAILLITDLYARDWHAEPLPGSVQQTYHLMPADYILRAVPLMAGHHRLRIIYEPASLPWGIAVSVTAWALWLGLAVWMRRRCPALK